MAVAESSPIFPNPFSEGGQSQQFFGDYLSEVKDAIFRVSQIPYNTETHRYAHFSIDLILELLQILPIDEYKFGSISVSTERGSLNSHSVAVIQRRTNGGSIIIEPQSGKDGKQIIAYYVSPDSSLDACVRNHIALYFPTLANAETTGGNLTISSAWGSKPEHYR